MAFRKVMPDRAGIVLPLDTIGTIPAGYGARRVVPIEIRIN